MSTQGTSATKRIDVEYTSEPTARQFHASDDFVRALVGPLGSGKSIACVYEIFLRSVMQQAYKGTRYTRWAIVRQTRPELLSTTIKSFREVIPEAMAPINFSAPIVAHMRFPLEDGTRVDSEVVFLAMELPKDLKKVLSLNLTGAWVNEARELPQEVFQALTGRPGRYPPKKWGGPTWSGVVLDTNPPDDDHWFHELFEVERPKGYSIFHQPPAMTLIAGTTNAYAVNPRADNLRNLQNGAQYYERLIAGKDARWIKVYVMGEYGSTSDGRPVWPEFVESAHLAPADIEPLRGFPLLVGLDFGLTPAAVICQISPTGQFRVLDEAVADNMGMRQFATDVLKPLFNSAAYFGLPVAITGDPAGRQRAQTDEQTCYDILAECGFRAESARTNDFVPRREAVARYLLRRDGFQVSPRCKVLRKALAGGYRYKRIQVSGDARYQDVPDKNLYSHPADALQYAAMSAEVAVAGMPGASTPPVEVVDSGFWGTT